MKPTAPAPRPSPDAIRTAVLLVAKLGGCSCNPEIRVLGAADVDVAHDAWCKHPSQRRSRS